MKKALVMIFISLFCLFSSICEEYSQEFIDNIYNNGVGQYYEESLRRKQQEGENGGGTGTGGVTGDDDGGGGGGGGGGAPSTPGGGDGDPPPSIPEGDILEIEGLSELIGQESSSLVGKYYLDTQFFELTGRLGSFQNTFTDYSSYNVPTYDEYITTSLDNQSKTNKQQNSELIGDPVYLTNGQYYDFQTDITIRYLNSNFDITRSYTSDSETSGCFGKNWISSLDERLIFGINTITKQDCDNFSLNTVLPVEKKLEELKKTYASMFNRSASEWSGISLFINSELQEIQKLYDEICGQESMASDLERNNRNTQCYQEARKLCEDVHALRVKIESIKAQYTECLSICNSYEGCIRNYQELLLQLQIQLAEMLDQVDRVNEVSARNTPALFPGTKDYCRFTGFETITLIDGTGGLHAFRNWNESSSEGTVRMTEGTVWIADNDAVYNSLTKTENGFTINQKDGSSRFYTKDGLLSAVAAPHGNTVSFERDKSFRITAISTSTGRRFTLSYNGDFIASIARSDLSYPLVQYGYTAERISSVTDRNQDTLRYTWNNNLLESMVKPDGSFIAFSYDEVDGNGRRITTETTDEEGFSEYFDYDFADRVTVHTDHSGAKTTYFFDDDYNTVKIIMPGGMTILRSYDKYGNMTSEQSNDGITFYSYDSMNRKTSAFYPDGTSEKWTWNDAGEITSYTDRDSIHCEYIFNSYNDLVTFKTGGQPIWTRTFSPEGLIETETIFSEMPVTTRFEYDTNGNVVKAVTGTKIEEWTWDENDTMTSYSIGGTIVNTHSENGNILTETNRTGLETQYTLNERKDIICVKETDTYTQETRVTEYNYDRRHHVTEIYKGDGKTRVLTGRMRYNGEGKLEAVIAYHGNSASIMLISYENNEGEKLLDPCSLSLFKLEPDEVSEHNLFNAEGFETTDLITLADSVSGKLCMPYQSQDNDPNIIYTPGGRISKTVTEYGGTYQYQYDVNGNPVSITDDYGNTTLKSFFPDGKTACVFSQNKQKLTASKKAAYHYDEQGRLISSESDKGKAFYYYDNFGNPSKSVTYNAGDTEVATYLITYDYDDTGRTITVTEGDYYSTTYCLNAWGEPVTVTDGNGNTLMYEHDFYGNTISLTDAYGNTTFYEYDQSGFKTKVTYPDGSWQGYEYDAAGNVTRTFDQAGTILTQIFDVNGNLIKKTGRMIADTELTWDTQNRLLSVSENGIPVQKNEYLSPSCIKRTDAKGNITVYEYDGYGNLLSETSENGLFIKQYDDAQSTSKLVRDIAGNIIEAVNENSHILYLYDSGTHLILQKNLLTGTELSFTYDRAGNRTCMTDGNRTVHYEYGLSNELTGMTEYENGSITAGVTFCYDCLGREVSRSYLNGVSRKTFFDVAGNVELITETDANGRLTHGEGFVYDANGRINACIVSDGTLTLYEYDARNCLSAILESDASDITSSENRESVYLQPDMYYSLQTLMNRMKITSGNALSVLQLMKRTEYRYDENLNRVIQTSGSETVSYEYDSMNRLISTTDVNMNYDNNGNLISEMTASKTVNYEYSSDNRIISSAVKDLLTGISNIQTYSYDPFGRRISTSSYTLDENGKYIPLDITTSEYDGFSSVLFNAFRSDYR